MLAAYDDHRGSFLSFSLPLQSRYRRDWRKLVVVARGCVISTVRGFFIGLVCPLEMYYSDFKSDCQHEFVQYFFQGYFMAKKSAARGKRKAQGDHLKSMEGPLPSQ